MINKLVLGTMKLKKYFKNSEDLSNFLKYAHKKGVKQIHVSNEYSSYNLLVRSLERLRKKKFSFILKLAESNNDKKKFNIVKFKKKINKYQKDLGKNNNFSIQLVNRYKCKSSKEYLINEKNIFNMINNTIIKLKKSKKIKSFYFFPYHLDKNKTVKQSFIDGITCYRNHHYKNNDEYAKKNNFKIIAMRTFGGNNKFVTKKNFKKLIYFNLKSRIVEKVIMGMNNKDQLDQILKIC